MRITKAILLLGLVIITNQVWSQKTLEGLFHEVTGMWAQEWNSFFFYADKSFFYQKESDFGNFHGYGTYELTWDSLILTFQEVPEELQNTRIFKGPPRSGGGTLIQARNGINPNEPVMISGSLYQGDSLLNHVKGDIFGNIYLDSGLTDVTLAVNAFSPNPDLSNRYYGTQSLHLEHTHAQSITLMFACSPPGTSFIEGKGVLRLKARVMMNGEKLKIYQKERDFFHPGGGTVFYNREEH